MFNLGKKRGFTLIELLVVISIISLLSSIVLSSLNTARGKARDSRRMRDLKALQVALELYYNDNGNYPTTGGAWWGTWGFGGVTKSNTGAGGYIANLAPKYIAVLPDDPKYNASNGYLYNSNGYDYMMLSWLSVEGSVPTAFVRPRSPEQTYAIYSPGYGSSCSVSCP